MRYVVRHDAKDNAWLVVDTLSVGQTVGRHLRQSNAVFQADAEERNWRLHGLGLETFALISQKGDLRVQTA